MDEVDAAVVQLPLHGGHAKGRHALVDANLPDLARLQACRWYVSPKGYPYTFDAVARGARRVSIKLHHLVLGTAAGQIVDHLNRDPLDNRRANLRPATPTLNAMNRSGPRGAVPLRGVSRRGMKYHAKLRWQGESLHLGDYDTAADAARVYDLVAVLLAGEFAQPNAARGRLAALTARLRRHLLPAATGPE